MLLCIDADMWCNLTKGKVYKMLFSNRDYYYIIKNDVNQNVSYTKDLFIKIGNPDDIIWKLF